jgi:hypothetical protein
VLLAGFVKAEAGSKFGAMAIKRFPKAAAAQALACGGCAAGECEPCGPQCRENPATWADESEVTEQDTQGQS